MKFTWILIAPTYTTLHGYQLDTDPFQDTTDRVLKSAYMPPSTTYTKTITSYSCD